MDQQTYWFNMYANLNSEVHSKRNALHPHYAWKAKRKSVNKDNQNSLKIVPRQSGHALELMTESTCNEVKATQGNFRCVKTERALLSKYE